MLTRIYIVTSGDERRLIEAGSAAQAIRHVVRHKYSAKAASPKDIATLMIDGRTVEQASDDYRSGDSSQTQQPSHTN